mgnify:CR=1 FL=1
MEEYEIYLKKALEQKNEFGSVNILPLDPNDRMIVDVLKRKGLITNIRYITMKGVGFDFTYEGLHYFDREERV